MKIRIRDNSIRLRLSRGEVDSVRENGQVMSVTAFPGGTSFRYTIESSPACVTPEAVFSGGEIRIRLPDSEVMPWASTERVSIAGEQMLDDGDKLTILVEKDFACLAPRPDEDESDMFPHPDKDSAAC